MVGCAVRPRSERPPSIPARGTKGYSFELWWTPHDKWWEWKRTDVQTHYFSRSHPRQRSPGRSDRSMRYLASKITPFSATMKHVWDVGCLCLMWTRFWTRLWRWAGDTGRETAGVSVDRHGGDCGGCASSKLPSQKTALFFFVFFLFQKWNTQARSHRDLQLFVRGLTDGCHLANPSADAASCLKTWRFIWCCRSSLQCSLQILQDPPHAYLLPLLIFSSHSPLSPSYLLLVCPSLPWFLLSFPFPPPLPKIRPSSVQFSLAGVQRGPGYPPRTLNRFGCYTITQLLLHAEGKTVHWPWVASHCTIVASGCRSRSSRISADERLISPSLWEASSWSISLGVAGEQFQQETFFACAFALLQLSQIGQWRQQVIAGSQMYVATEPKHAGKYAVRKYKTYFFLPPQNGKWYCLTHVILSVDYGVVVCWAAGVSLHGFYVISAVGCVDGSLKLTLQHRAVAGRSVFTCGKRPCGQYNVKQCKR